MGKLYVIEGLDGSGKSTQSQRVVEMLQEQGEKVKLISFPDYESRSCELVKMYLNGDFSNDPDAVNAYAASSFYAVDRFASYMLHWKKEYDQGEIIIASRYVDSNAIHQMVKLPKEKWDEYLSWLYDYEYNKLGLPKPDKVIFLNMPREVADRLIFSRYGGDESKKDIHESNMAYLNKCRISAEYAANKLSWDVVECATEQNEPLPLKIITEKIMDLLKK